MFSQQLDRDKPLGEVWWVEGLADDRFAVLSKTHHALVDGISGVDIMSVLFETSPSPRLLRSRGPLAAAPLPSSAQLLGEALVERATIPGEITRTLRAIVRGPRRIIRGCARCRGRRGRDGWAGLNPAPASPYNKRIGPHRASPGSGPISTT